MGGDVGAGADGVGPLGAVLVVGEGGGVAELAEDGVEGRAFGDGGLGFDADLVAGGVDGIFGAGLALVRDGADGTVLTDAEDLPSGAEITGGGVVEDVVLEGAGSFELEAECGETGLEGEGVGDGELELDLGTLHG